MKTIYEPTGKAREYSPLAVNLYSGCGHKCQYCYVPQILQLDRKNFDSIISGRTGIIKELERDARKSRNSDKQVLMSFTSDPYNPYNDTFKLTRKALEIFLDNEIPVAILSKGGKRALQDMDIIQKFGKHIKIGASLTYLSKEDSLKHESGAAIPDERIETLQIFHENGVRTWVSFEPIMNPKDTWELLKKSLPFVDEFQLGKLSGDNRVIDWNKFLNACVNYLRSNNKDFYIKDSLRMAGNQIKLNSHEMDRDYLTLPAFEKIADEIFS